MRSLALFAALAAAACVEVPQVRADAGPDGVYQCFDCHSDLADAWSLPSAHRLLFQCTDCHGFISAYGPGHMSRRPCLNCHSEQSHQGYDCARCHTPHGSANAFLIRERIDNALGGTSDIHVSGPQGASPDGLVRAGVDGQTPGTGLCEVCHTTTAHYTGDGSAPAHHTDWCARCHSHQRGFAPGAPEY
jgi:predicted CXXCH cytochrome family protein